MTNFIKFYCLAFITLFSTLAMAQNQTISLQSTLKNISGEAVADGMQSITFKFYSDLEGGSAIWTETADVEVVSGIYSHELGSVTPLVPADFGIQLYLGVTINNKELDPRTKLGFAPYAMSVSALAASGESASFDVTGKFIVSDKMKVLDVIETNGITNTGSINSTGLIQSMGSIFATEFESSGKIGLGVPSNTTTLDLAIDLPGTGLNGKPFSLDFHTNDDVTPKMTILNNGRVGIGTTTPDAPLHVKGTNNMTYAEAGLNDANEYSWSQLHWTSYSSDANHVLKFPAPGTPQDKKTTDDICAYFENSVVMNRFLFIGNTQTWSDNRIKTNLQVSNAASDLALLNQIEITEYDHIDKINKDTKRQKKVIAQQVQEVLPNVIQKSRMVIPNVYELAKYFEYKEGILSVQTEKVHDFAVGDKIDLKTPKKDLDRVTVTAVIDDHTFAIEAEEKPENVFVYGKYVDDFLSVDYDAIAMLNVSATQEMYRMIMNLQQANNNLIKANKALKSSTADIEDRLAMLEAMMFKSENNNISNTETVEK